MAGTLSRTDGRKRGVRAAGGAGGRGGTGALTSIDGLCRAVFSRTGPCPGHVRVPPKSKHQCQKKVSLPSGTKRSSQALRLGGGGEEEESKE